MAKSKPLGPRLPRGPSAATVVVMAVETIKDAGLSEDDRHSAAAWLNGLEYDAWDRQMAEDFSPGGRGTAWAQKVKSQIADWKAFPVEDGFAQRR